MTKFDIFYKNNKLRVCCDEYIEKMVKEHLVGHINICDPIGEFTYKLVIGDNLKFVNGMHYKMVDKWFENATLDCYIDNYNRTCYVTNFIFKKNIYKELLIKYFTANLFNRLLELDMYLGVHSSCVEKDNSGILFVAERLNGKTICMLNLMNEGYNIVSNDVTALKKCRDELIAYGIAQDVSIRLSKEFCSQKENKKYIDYAKSMGVEFNNNEIIDAKNFHISECELAALNNVKQTMCVPIKAIVRPCYNPYINHLEFYEMSKTQQRELIYSQYRSLVHETTDFLNYIKLDGIDEKIRYSKFENIIDIPAYYCHQNEKTTQEFVKQIEKIRCS